ncbi:MAG: geranylgeranylglyceryl/heptaprenylglyceryl phosphate synthase [Bacteroidetes bacterium]|nr:MAG: geranylgeranylglyceryl/heptaprenylglyceryl phosphate synthase [Bacteroidota bacterium]
MSLYTSIISSAKHGNKQFAVLLDPDKYTLDKLKKVITLSCKSGVDYFFFGGSLLTRDQQDLFLTQLKENCDIPVILFPGNHFQINRKADGILFLSLISGRNPELLIGKHVVAAPYLKAVKLEVIPTGYLLIDGGNRTTVAYMSNTDPIPSDKSEIAVCTALAGELLGLKLIYLDAGSGARNPVPENMLKQVKKYISVPLVVGGGIRTPQQAVKSIQAGADMVVVGNAIEENIRLIPKLSEAIHG